MLFRFMLCCISIGVLSLELVFLSKWLGHSTLNFKLGHMLCNHKLYYCLKKKKKSYLTFCEMHGCECVWGGWNRDRESQRDIAIEREIDRIRESISQWVSKNQREKEIRQNSMEVNLYTSCPSNNNDGVKWQRMFSRRFYCILFLANIGPGFKVSPLLSSENCLFLNSYRYASPP